MKLLTWTGQLKLTGTGDARLATLDDVRRWAAERGYRLVLADPATLADD